MQVRVASAGRSFPRNPREEVAAAAILVSLVAIALWVPALRTPFWGDDFGFLEEAMRARLAGARWWEPFWPAAPVQFWRPLGHETYWRVVETFLEADPVAAHAVNLGLWMLACLCVGTLASALGRAMQWRSIPLLGTMSAAIYGALAIHFTPLHWTSSADSFFVIIFLALAQAAWLLLPRSGGWTRVLLVAALPTLQLLGLFSKESAIVLPLLCIALSVLVGRWPLGREQKFAAALCVVVVIAWLVVRPRFVYQPPDEYAIEVGWNVLRNAAALVGWLMNVPREAVRMLAAGDIGGLWWAAAAAVPMSVFVASAAVVLRPVVTRQMLAAFTGYVVLSYAPYFFLHWQSYEYYAGVAAILPACLLARAACSTRSARAALALLCISSAVVVEGSRRASYPSLIGRALEANAQSEALLYSRLLEPDLEDAPLLVVPRNAHHFYALGRSGIAWRLGEAPQQARVAAGCEDFLPTAIEMSRDGVRTLPCVEDDLEDGS